MQGEKIYRVLANAHRLQILEWLKDPVANFPPQVDGDLVKDGVCAVLIAKKLGLTPSTLSEHMRLLVEADFVTPKRIKQWTFYRRNEGRIAEIGKALTEDL